MSYAAVVSGTQSITFVNTATAETLTLSGGSASWRDNNPGNLPYNASTVAAGAIGKDSGGLAIFADQNTGALALEPAIKAYSNAGATISSAISALDPAPTANLAAFQSFLSAVGASATTKVSALNANQMVSLLNGIIKVEGMVSGTAKYFVPPADGGGTSGTTFAVSPGANVSFIDNSQAPVGYIPTIFNDPEIDSPIPTGASGSPGDSSGDGGAGDDGGGSDGGGSEDDYSSDALKSRVEDHCRPSNTCHSVGQTCLRDGGIQRSFRAGYRKVHQDPVKQPHPGDAARKISDEMKQVGNCGLCCSAIFDICCRLPGQGAGATKKNSRASRNIAREVAFRNRHMQGIS